MLLQNIVFNEGKRNGTNCVYSEYCEKTEKSAEERTYTLHSQCDNFCGLGQIIDNMDCVKGGHQIGDLSSTCTNDEQGRGVFGDSGGGVQDG